MTPKESRAVKPGDQIILEPSMNEEWTRGVVFNVNQVHYWGVVCFTRVRHGELPLRAKWERIAMRVPKNDTTGEPYLSPQRCAQLYNWNKALAIVQTPSGSFLVNVFAADVAPFAANTQSVTTAKMPSNKRAIDRGFEVIARIIEAN